MADFRKWFLVLAAVALLAGTANAQGFQCTANAGVPPLVRAEGIAELTGDLVLNCSGIVPAGGITANIRIFLNTNVTTRLTSAGSLPRANEALLLIGDPLPAQQTYLPAGTLWNGVDPYPNVFQGLASGVNTIDWLGVPLAPPGSAGSLSVVYRFTNIRANASQLGVASGLVPQTIQAFISVSGSTSVPINNPTQVIGYVQKGMTFSVGDPLNLKQCELGQEDTVTVTFTEGFANSFKQVGDNTQTTPNFVYDTESGLHPAAGAVAANFGVASQGTRLWFRFTEIPDGVELSAPAQISPSDDPGLVLCSVPDTNSSGAGGGMVCTGTYTPTISGGSAVFVYEVQTADSDSVHHNDVVDITVTVDFDGTPELTTGDGVLVQGNFAPVSTVTGPSATAPVPRFIDVSVAGSAITVNACRTILLFPYVTNAAMFDTGIAISNTSADPLETEPQEGACVLNYYGNIPATGAPAPAAVTTPVVEAGEQLAFIVSSGGGVVGTDKTCAACATPGFHGYVIAVCDFQYAHAFAFVSDLGAAKLAEGYLALVIPDRGGRDAQAFSLGALSNEGEQLVH